MDFMDIHISQSTIIQIFKLQFTQTHCQQLKQSTDAPFDQKLNRQSKMKFFVKVHILSKDSSFDHWMIIIHQGKTKKVNRQSKMKFFVKVHILSKDSSFDHWMIIIHQGKIKNQQNPKIQN